MPPLIDLKGKRFGRLIVVERIPISNKRTMWICKCDCGNEVSVDAYNLKSGHTQSCGCIHKEVTSRINKTHGLGNTRLYRIWNHMKTRCYRKSYHAFQHYGGRGIRVCDEWLHNFQSFYDWAMSNGYEENLSIDRIDTNGNYSPDNCRWATMADQNKNKRAKNGYKIKEDI